MCSTPTPTDILDAHHKVFKHYIDSAKSYIQLSTGALALSVFFTEKIIVASLAKLFEYYLFWAWSFWLAAILAGAGYHYFAVKRLENIGYELGLFRKPLVRGCVKDPGWIYGLMLVFFYGAALFFIAYAIENIRS